MADELGETLAAEEVSRSILADGTVEIILSASCAQAGIGQILVAQAGESKARTAISVTEFHIAHLITNYI